MARRTPEQMADKAEAALRRAKAEFALERVKAGKDLVRAKRRMLAVHRAAEQNRFTRDWYAPVTSADSANLSDLMRVNARSRQVVRDDAWGKSIVRSFDRNVIGTGITPLIPKQAPWAQDWEAHTRSCHRMDLEKRRNLIGMQRWAVRELVTVGECFVVRWIVNDSNFGAQLRLQCFEFEQLDRYKLAHTDHLGVVRDVRHGIEVDEHGAAVAYHFYRHHPNDARGLGRPSPMSLESFRVPASMVCHVYDPDRVRQTHGISRLAPVLRKLRDLAEYDAAQLRVARAEASIGLLIRGSDDFNGSDTSEPLEIDGLSVAYLGAEEEVTPFVPSRPGNTYDPFVRAQLKSIAAGVGISYDQIARDFDEGSYSSKRQASLEDRREFEPIQHLIVGSLLDPIIEDFQLVWHMQHASTGDFFLNPSAPVIPWQGQGWEWVDPEAQGKGVERKMKLGLTSRSREANLLGVSVYTLDAERAADGTETILGKIDSGYAPAPVSTQVDALLNPDPEQQPQGAPNA